MFIVAQTVFGYFVWVAGLEAAGLLAVTITFVGHFFEEIAQTIRIEQKYYPYWRLLFYLMVVEQLESVLVGIFLS